MFRRRLNRLGWVRPHPVRQVPGDAVRAGQADTTEEDWARWARYTAWAAYIALALTLPAVIVTQIAHLTGRVHP